LSYNGLTYIRIYRAGHTNKLYTLINISICIVYTYRVINRVINRGKPAKQKTQKRPPDESTDKAMKEFIL